MNIKQKNLDKFIKAPTSLHYREISKILEGIGFEQLDGKGSHEKWKHLNCRDDLVFPIHNHDCKDFYKKQALSKLKNYNLI